MMNKFSFVGLVAIAVLGALLVAAIARTYRGTVTITVTAGGACGTPSPYVPCGYTCKTAASDEFNGTILDPTKWLANADPSLNSVSGGYAHIGVTATSHGGFTSTDAAATGNAPLYIEVRTGWSGPGLASTATWICGSHDWTRCYGTGEAGEIDFDEVFVRDLQCVHVHYWVRGIGDVGDGGYTGAQGCIGSINVRDGNMHLLGWQILSNGKMYFWQDGQLISSGSVNTSTYPGFTKPTLGGQGGYHFITGGNCGDCGDGTIYQDFDYYRVYCLGCN